MKIVSWNVNGLRAVLKNRETSLKAFLDGFDADVICLQETKASRQGLDRSSCIANGYASFFSFCKVKGGYSGVVTFCRRSATPVRAEEGLTGLLAPANDGVGLTGDCPTHFTGKDNMTEFDAEGRAVLTEHTCGDVRGVTGDIGQTLVVINVYCPMVDRENINKERLSYKMLFYSVLQDRCIALEQAGRHVIVAGDLNCSREAIDSAYIQDTPTLLHGCPEREWMKTFVITNPPSLPPSHPPSLPPSLTPSLPPSLTPSSPSLLLDTFRHLHPHEASVYTCWSTFFGYRKTNYGTRIDYILSSLSLAPCLSRAEVWADMTGSDHCPIMADFSLSLTPSPRDPSLSLHLLLGRQTTLSSFLQPKSSSAHSTTDNKQEVKGESSLIKPSGKGVKRKTPDMVCSSAKVSKTLTSYFRNDPPNVGSGTGSVSTTDTREKIEPSSSAQLDTEWMSLFSGPPRPPLCKKHGEEAILRTVRKAGPTKGRRFWVCSRPAGSRSDPSTQCDFFQWLTPSKAKRKVT